MNEIKYINTSKNSIEGVSLWLILVSLGLYIFLIIRKYYLGYISTESSINTRIDFI